MTAQQSQDPKKTTKGTGRTTKKAQLIRMLQSKTGSGITAISAKLGWQSHTTRAALTGLRKAGYEIAATKSEGGKPTRYRITAGPESKGPNSGSAKVANAG
jgi:predicted ArsR family transcriptional regulator